MIASIARSSPFLAAPISIISLGSRQALLPTTGRWAGSVVAAAALFAIAISVDRALPGLTLKLNVNFNLRVGSVSPVCDLSSAASAAPPEPLELGAGQRVDDTAQPVPLAAAPVRRSVGRRRQPVAE